MKIFITTVKRKFPRIYLAICQILNLFIHQVNIFNAYLESLLRKNELLIFINLPPEMHNVRQI